MKLSNGIHLAYCTNIHRGETWEQIFAALKTHTLAVRQAVCPSKPYAIGLRLGIQAARDLSEPRAMLDFQHWLEKNNCYVFTINGFPYGQFHGTRIKEQVYLPDWSTRDRLDYTVMLFELLGQLLLPDVEGSISTVPVSFKEFIRDESHLAAVRQNLWACADHIHKISRRYGRNLHLALEPEPLCYLETTEECIAFFETLRSMRPGDTRLEELIGINYDCCHLAIEFEDPSCAIPQLIKHDIRIGKIHLSNALTLRPDPSSLEQLKSYQDEVYFHQVVERGPDGVLKRFKDIDEALADMAGRESSTELPEWRVHYHIPLHSEPAGTFGNTSGHLRGVLDAVADRPGLCRHFEMETYTWDVMPEPLKKRNVTDQLVAEYQWTLARFAERGILPA